MKATVQVSLNAVKCLEKSNIETDVCLAAKSASSALLSKSTKIVAEEKAINRLGECGTCFWHDLSVFGQRLRAQSSQMEPVQLRV